MKKNFFSLIFFFFSYFLLDFVLYPLSLYVIIGGIYSTINEVIKSVIGYSNEKLTIIVWIIIFLFFSLLLILKKWNNISIYIILFFLSYFIDASFMLFGLEVPFIIIIIKSLFLAFIDVFNNKKIKL